MFYYLDHYKRETKVISIFLCIYLYIYDIKYTIYVIKEIKK